MKLTLAVFILSASALAHHPRIPVTDVLRDSLAGRQKNTVAAIEAMPAEQFSFKPTPEQMSFGHLAAHIVEANYFFCSKVGDVPQPKVEGLTEAAGKENLVAAVKASFEFCGTALAKAEDSKLGDPIKDFTGKIAPEPGRLWPWLAAGPITMALRQCTSGSRACCHQQRKRSRKKIRSERGAPRRRQRCSNCVSCSRSLLAHGWPDDAGPPWLGLHGCWHAAAGRTRARRTLHVSAVRGSWRGYRTGRRSLAQLGALAGHSCAAAGVVMLLPSVSSALLDFRFGRLAWGGLGTIVRVIIVWYLTQPDTRDAFEPR